MSVEINAQVTVPISLQPHQVIDYVRDESLYERHSCCHPDFGRGQEVLYDFGGIEAELAGALVVGKAHLQTVSLVGQQLFAGLVEENLRTLKFMGLFSAPETA